MQVIEIRFGINDEVYTVDAQSWDEEKRAWRNYVVKKYRIRSISISCNSKGEWKRSYRAQRVNDDKTIDYGFNFREDDVGDFVFTNYEDAKTRCDEENKSVLQPIGNHISYRSRSK